MKKQLNKQLGRLIETSEEISKIIESREETFESRSERWQESEKGEAFQELTEELRGDIR